MYHLPIELIEHIARHLNDASLLMLKLTCTFYDHLINNHFDLKSLKNTCCENDYDHILRVLNVSEQNDREMKICVERGHVKCFQWLYVNGHTLHTDLLHIAAQHGHLNFLRWLSCFNDLSNQIVIDDLLMNVAKGGHLDCLKWIVSHYDYRRDCRKHFNRTKLCETLAYHNHFECLKWAYVNAFPLHHRVMVGAASVGNLKMMQWLRARERPCNINYLTLLEAARHNHLDCLVWAHEILQNNYWTNRKFTWHVKIMIEAAKHGHLRIMQYIHEHDGVWHENVCSSAALNGHLECLQYAMLNGCPFTSKVCANAAFNGHLNCLQWAHENGCAWKAKVCARASYNGHNTCLQYALEHDNFIKGRECEYALRGGHLRCLQLLLNHGYELPLQAYHLAIKNNALSCLECIFQTGFNIHWITNAASIHDILILHSSLYKYFIYTLLEYAIRFGHLQIVQWLIQHGHLARTRYFNIMIRYDHLHILQWWHENDYAIPSDIVKDVIYFDNARILKWMHERHLFNMNQIPEIMEFYKKSIKCYRYLLQYIDIPI